MARLDVLKAKLAAREGKPEFKDNCAELRAEIERIEKSLALSEFIESNQEDSL